MTRLERLKKEARRTATRRGHTLGAFRADVISPAATSSNYGKLAECETCGRYAAVIPGDSYEIFGEAVAVNCS